MWPRTNRIIEKQGTEQAIFTFASSGAAQASIYPGYKSFAKVAGCNEIPEDFVNQHSKVLVGNIYTRDDI